MLLQNAESHPQQNIIPFSWRPNALLSHIYILYKSSCTYNTITKEPSCKSQAQEKESEIEHTLSAHAENMSMQRDLMRRWHVRCCCKHFCSQFRIIARGRTMENIDRKRIKYMRIISAKQVWLCDMIWKVMELHHLPKFGEFQRKVWVRVRNEAQYTNKRALKLYQHDVIQRTTIICSWLIWNESHFCISRLLGGGRAPQKQIRREWFKT